MIVERTYWVRVPGEEEPFEVVVAPDEEEWTITVRRADESWSYRIAAGPAEGRAWIDGRPTSYHYDASGDGPARLALDGVVHTLVVETEAEHRLAALGIGAGGGDRAREIRAPMPGLVLELAVAEGDRVAEGDGILIVEAMKMENEVHAPIDGVVVGLSVEAGQAVEQGAVLCRIEPPEET
ncbi:MAG: biotin/lipoyl-containing protein [Gemmatimonadota bacterium]|nr:biotin/lipoyl-containing protein [Gemmatimonadota bacterium]